jgi:hypothetical protein
MLRLRYSVLLVFAALTLVLLFLRIDIVDGSRAKAVDHGSGSRKQSKSRGGEMEQATSPPEHPLITSLLFDHGTPPAPLTTTSLTASYPSIIRPGAIIATTDSAGPPSATRGESSSSLASIKTATYSTRLTGSPTPEESTTDKASSALTQEEFEKEHDAIAL